MAHHSCISGRQWLIIPAFLEDNGSSFLHSWKTMAHHSCISGRQWLIIPAFLEDNGSSFLHFWKTMAHHSCIPGRQWLIIPAFLEDNGSSFLHFWKTMAHHSCIVNTMVAEGLVLVTQGITASSTMVLTLLFQIIPVSAAEAVNLSCPTYIWDPHFVIIITSRCASTNQYKAISSHNAGYKVINVFCTVSLSIDDLG